MYKRQASPIDGEIVLCVDNETEILDGMKGLIGKWGAAPITASSPREAAAAADRIFAEQGRWPALLLVDYHLNDHVTGLDVIDELRNKALCKLPAVILTADHSQTVADLVGEAGITLLRKPVKPAALRALVNRMLSRQIAD